MRDVAVGFLAILANWGWFGAIWLSADAFGLSVRESGLLAVYFFLFLATVGAATWIGRPPSPAWFGALVGAGGAGLPAALVFGIMAVAARGFGEMEGGKVAVLAIIGVAYFLLALIMGGLTGWMGAQAAERLLRSRAEHAAALAAQEEALRPLRAAPRRRP